MNLKIQMRFQEIKVYVKNFNKFYTFYLKFHSHSIPNPNLLHYFNSTSEHSKLTNLLSYLLTISFYLTNFGLRKLFLSSLELTIINRKNENLMAQ